ncbi:MAG: prolyl oligopeptidase family serine peptidase, partial [Actinomycetota bacterium]|nr:prolyl oligopeptidase family serine peptidase [Actinomycetota bacterium]
MEWQIFASNGYLVLAINPRGSSGRGEEFQKAI